MYKLTASVIALQKGMLYLDSHNTKGGPTAAGTLAHTVHAELMQLGYMLDSQAFQHFMSWSADDIIRYHDEVIPYIRYIRGDGAYRPLYDGFPRQVMDMTEAELFVNAVRHYMSDGLWVPNAYTQARPTAFEHPTYTVLRLAGADVFGRILTDILSVNQSITPMDKAAAGWFIDRYPADALRGLVPSAVPFKENLCFLLSTDAFRWLPYTYTDILRTAVYLSGGDVSLTTLTRFRLTHSQRDRIMQMLEHKAASAADKVGLAFLNSLEDLKKHRSRWLALFRHIHADSCRYRRPGYANALRVVELVRFHADHIRSWQSRVEQTLHSAAALDLLKQRPGEFARRLGSLLAGCIGGADTAMSVTDVTDAFAAVASQVSNKVLFELYTYFEGRRTDQTLRTVFVKGARKPVKLTPLDRLPADVVDRMQQVILDGVRHKFTAWPSLGRVVIDDRLKGLPLPTNMRSVSETDAPMARGTRMPIRADHTRVVRFYVHWHDARGSEDLDLSATLVGFGMRSNVSFNTNYVLEGDAGTVAVHSGDVRDRRGDCAEYIDIDISNARRSGYRYVIIDVRNYNGRSLKSISPAFGYMQREYPEANSWWVPSTVAASWRLQSEALGCIAVMIDLESMEYIPLDIDSGSITATGDTEAVFTAMQMYMTPPKVSVHDLVMWHAQARGAEVLDSVPAEGGADVTHFRFEDFATSYVSTLKLMADTPSDEG